MPNFVQRHQSQLYLLPPDLRDWLPEDDLAHFVVEAVERVPLERFQVNERGTGSAQYHPRMMLALLVYCYANGIFGSRRIERATYRDIGVRYVAGELSSGPRHDLHVPAQQLRSGSGGVSAGTAAGEGTAAAACWDGERGRDEGGREREQAQQHPLRPGGGVARAVARRDRGVVGSGGARRHGRRAGPAGSAGGVVAAGQAAGEAGPCVRGVGTACEARADSERAEYERKVAARARRTGSRKGRHIKPPTEAPEAKAQINLTDADSALMRKSRHHEYRQAYNAQAAVDADGSQLVLGSRVSVCASDRNELVADVEAIPAAVGAADRVLADSGYATGSEVSQLAGRGVEVLVATGAEGQRRRHDFRPEPPEPLAKEPQADWIKSMQEKMALPEHRGALPFAPADGGAGVRDREAGDGLPAVSAAGS